MSFRALSWAANQDCKSALQKLVLIMLANYSDENDSSFPSYKHLASICHCNERTIMRVVKSLQERGFIEIENRFVDGKQTSNRFILNIANRGDKNDRVGVTENTPNTVRLIHNKKIEKKDGGYCSDFCEWWAAYPRRDGSKKQAYQKWKKAIASNVSIPDLLAYAKVFAHSVRGKDLQYVAHAATWLHQRRWETISELHTRPKTKNAIAG